MTFPASPQHTPEVKRVQGLLDQIVVANLPLDVLTQMTRQFLAVLEQTDTLESAAEWAGLVAGRKELVLAAGEFREGERDDWERVLRGTAIVCEKSGSSEVYVVFKGSDDGLYAAEFLREEKIGARQFMSGGNPLTAEEIIANAAPYLRGNSEFGMVIRSLFGDLAGHFLARKQRALNEAADERRSLVGL